MLARLAPPLLVDAMSLSTTGFRGSCLSPATPSRRSLVSQGTTALSTTGSSRSPWALLPSAPLRDSSRSTMTHSTSMVALACPAPQAAASNPPWASSRSPGTTALTQVRVSQLWLGGGSTVGTGLGCRQELLCHLGLPWCRTAAPPTVVDGLFSLFFSFLDVSLSFFSSFQSKEDIAGIQMPHSMVCAML